MNTKLNIKLMSVVSLLMVLISVGCSLDYPTTASRDLPRITTSGTADFSKFVVAGNSLTAGYQSGGLAGNFQVNSYPAMISRQLGIENGGYSGSEFEQPLASDSGTSGILILNYSPTGPIASSATAITAPFVNTNLTRSYDNMAVPGAFVYDFLNTTASGNGWGGLILSSPNTLFDAILRNSGTQFQQVKSLSPSFVIWWEGHNDILGYATRGAGVHKIPGSTQGAPPYTPRNSTEAGVMGIPFNFTTMYTAAIDSLAATGADVIVGNIPYVTDIPYFTTVFPSTSIFAVNDSIYLVTNALTGAKSGLFFEEDLTGADDSIKYMLLPVSSLLGKTNVPGFTGLPYGLHPSARIQGRYTITHEEATNIAGIIDGYNTIISTVADAKGIAVVDFKSYFSQIKTDGYTLPNGTKAGASFLSGGLFSLDGVHPSTLGYAVVANKWILEINNKFNSEIPLVRITDYMNIK